MGTLELPAWVDELRTRYLAGHTAVFLLHGNIQDLQPWATAEGVQWLDLTSFLTRWLSASRERILRFDPARGLTAAHGLTDVALLQQLQKASASTTRPKLTSLPDRSRPALEAVEDLLTDPTTAGALLIEDAEMVVPSAPISALNPEDRGVLARLRRWTSDAKLLRTDNLVLLITKEIQSIAPTLRDCPDLVTVRIPYPSESTRERYLREQDLNALTTLSLAQLAQFSAGLTLTALRSMVTLAQQSEIPITFETITAQKAAMIEQSCAGLVELVEPHHTLDDVGGIDAIKAQLQDVANAIQQGKTKQVPMGMIFLGAMGTGKTWVAEAFAKSSGLTCLTLRSFRGSLVGETEANLERVLDLIDALGYAMLIIDEAERTLSTQSQHDAVNSRVIARLKEFLADSSHRGRVLVVMMTNRPDKLDADLKRPGRADLRIPFFYPEDDGDRLALIEAIIRKNHIDLKPDTDLFELAYTTPGYSAAELEALLLSAVTTCAREGRELVSASDLRAAHNDVIRSRDSDIIAYMEMQAVYECSNRRMLPARYRDLSDDEITQRLAELRLKLASRLTD